MTGLARRLTNPRMWKRCYYCLPPVARAGEMFTGVTSPWGHQPVGLHPSISSDHLEAWEVHGFPIRFPVPEHTAWNWFLVLLSTYPLGPHLFRIVLRIEPGTLHMLGTHSTTKLPLWLSATSVLKTSCYKVLKCRSKIHSKIWYAYPLHSFARPSHTSSPFSLMMVPRGKCCCYAPISQMSKRPKTQSMA